MYKCENHDRCKVKECNHKQEHGLRTLSDDSCLSPCDVEGGVKGSRCFDRQGGWE